MHTVAPDEVRSVEPFRSILFRDTRQGVPVEDRATRSYFADLNLDQVIDAVVLGRDEYDLEPLFLTLLERVDDVHYRHEAFHDLDGTQLLAHVREFAGRMHDMRAQLAHANGLRYERQRQRWFLDAVATYCEAVAELGRSLDSVDPASRAFVALRRYVAELTESDPFATLVADVTAIEGELAEITYCVHIDGGHVEVSAYDGQSDYSAEVTATFAKFAEGQLDPSDLTFRDWPDMNHVEARILELVSALFPEPFRHLEQFCTDHRDYLDPVVERFDREVQFYVAYLEYIDPLRSAGMSFCYPHLSASKEVSAEETFDIALAHRLVAERAPIVCNDFVLRDPERVIVVTGPNQGGKTTFARTFGQLHYLARLGCPVPGTDARLFLFDRLFTHFEKEEDLASQSGKLQDDVVRIHSILEEATPESIVILNEIFTSTTVDDALSLGTKVLEHLIALDALCVCVTFIDEWASLGPTTVSMVSTVDPENPAVRTYKVVKRAADGLAYAVALAEKYGLTYTQLKERLDR